MSISRANKAALFVGGVTMAVTGGVLGGLSGVTEFGVEEIIEATLVGTVSPVCFAMITRLFAKQVEKESREVKQLEKDQAEQARRDNPQNSVERYVRKEDLIDFQSIRKQYNSAAFVARGFVEMGLRSKQDEMRGLLGDVEPLFAERRGDEAREMIYGFMMGYRQHRGHLPWLTLGEAADLKARLDPNLGADARAWVSQRIDELVGNLVW